MRHYAENGQFCAKALNHVLSQAELAQEEAQQLQGAGYFAEAAALSTAAHKWRKKAVKVVQIQHRQTWFVPTRSISM